jgi:hypothetical protein
MDQLRKAWAWFVRHHFWVLTVVTVIVAAFCWYSGATALQQAFASNKSKIEQQSNSISTLRSNPFKPNEEVNNKQQEQIDIQTKAVHALWQQLYDRQRDEVLKWPENLSDQFRTYVEKLKFNEAIPEDLRNHYNNYVRDHFPELPKIVGALLAPEGDGAGGGRGYSQRSMMGGRGDMRGESMMMGGPGGETIEEEEFIVEWLDQDRIRAIGVANLENAGRLVGLRSPAQDYRSYEQSRRRRSLLERRGAGDRNDRSRRVGGAAKPHRRPHRDCPVCPARRRRVRRRHDGRRHEYGPRSDGRRYGRRHGRRHGHGPRRSNGW